MTALADDASTITHAYALKPSTNADGLPVLPMTAEQKYVFDLKGWLLLPSLLTGAQIEAIREHQMKLLYRRDDLPVEQRDGHGGPSQVLLDHPAVVGVLNEILSHQNVATEECYGFRCDHTYTSHRKPGHDNFSPHGGGGYFAFCGNSHLYQMLPGKVHAGLTRVVWEINPVEHGRGGTLLLSGSHKTAFPRPASLSVRESPLWETYGCPAGSALIFTEALCHTGTTWQGPHERLALFTCYNTIGAKWAKQAPSAEVLAAMPAKRQSLFRGVWTGMPPGKGLNTYVDDLNRAI